MPPLEDIIEELCLFRIAMKRSFSQCLIIKLLTTELGVLPGNCLHPACAVAKIKQTIVLKMIDWYQLFDYFKEPEAQLV